MHPLPAFICVCRVLMVQVQMQVSYGGSQLGAVSCSGALAGGAIFCFWNL